MYRCTFLFLVVYILLPFVHTVRVVPGMTEQYDMAKYCNGPTIVVNAAAILTLNSGDLTHSTRQCDVTIESRWLTTDSSLRLEIVALNVPCQHRESLQVFNGAAGNASHVSISYPDMICTDGNRNYQAMYLNNGNTVSLAIRVNSSHEAEITMELLATATAYLPEPKIADFRCDNNLRIVNELTCDGNNNCGDRSDETELLCDTKKSVETQRTIFFITTIVLGSVLVVVVVGVVIYCCCCVKTMQNPGPQRYVQFDREGGQQQAVQRDGDGLSPQHSSHPPVANLNVMNGSAVTTSNSGAGEGTSPKLVFADHAPTHHSSD